MTKWRRWAAVTREQKLFQAQLAVGRMSNVTGSDGTRTGELGGLGEDAGCVKAEAQGVSGLVSDAKTYADMMGAESRAACKHT